MNQLCGELQNVFTNGHFVGKAEIPEQYHARNSPRGNANLVMTRSELVEFNQCPHRWIGGYKSEENDATEWGSLVDCIALTPAATMRRFAICPEYYLDDKGNKKRWNFNANACKAWKAENMGKRVVKHEKHEDALKASSLLWSDPTICEILSISTVQALVKADYHDEETGITVRCKALLDIVPPKDDPHYGKMLLDLKTTTNASEGAWTKKVWEMSYHVQAAFYLDLYTAATMEDRTDFWHIVQESIAPWETVIWPLSSDFIELGRLAYRDMLARYCQCLKNDTWPSYTPGNRWIQPQPYMLNK